MLTETQIQALIVLTVQDACGEPRPHSEIARIKTLLYVLTGSDSRVSGDASDIYTRARIKHRVTLDAVIIDDDELLRLGLKSDDGAWMDWIAGTRP